MRLSLLWTRANFFIICLLLSLVVMVQQASAAPVPSGDFSLEVSPSPLTATVEPGKAKTLELRVHNASKQAEELKIEARDFRITYPGQTVVIGTSTPPDLAQWVSFSTPTFVVQPGEWHTEKITISLPEKAGFSYPFTLVISRKNEQAVEASGRLLKASIAVFTLVNVDKPGATRKLEIEDFSTSQGIYEYLPATFTLKIKNTGNSIVQPYGNLYVQRQDDAATPLSVMPVNEARSYILPGNSKEITAQWLEGFPAYAAATTDTKSKPTLHWDWQKAGNFRIGRYTAKVVAVYNDGTRDVPITGEVSFWVIPWRILLGVFIALLLVGFGIWSIVRQFARRVGKFSAKNRK